MRTIAEINEKISQGKAVVLTAEEMVRTVREKGPDKAAGEVDVVTTGTFGMMCSSGAFLNFGHAKPRIRAQRVYLNKVPAYAGIAAVDAYIGATEIPVGDKANTPFPGEFRYGGAHVIEDLVRGKAVRLRATAHATDCYPLKEIDTYVSLKTMNQAVLMNVRNCYQNYAAATNTSSRTLYTYMGKLLPELGNATYCSAGELSPLMNDPYYRTIGIGTRIFLGGGEGFVVWEGTQFNTGVPRSPNGVPKRPAGSLAVLGDLKQMTPEFVKGLTFTRYGASLGLGIGVPIPILDEDVAKSCAVLDKDISTAIFDYSNQTRARPVMAEPTYEQLSSGEVEIKGKRVPTSPLSSISKARQICELLKKRIEKREFAISAPVQRLPLDRTFKPLDAKTEKEAME